MDLDNPVVRLCVDGMQAELDGRHADARDLFLRAWAARTDAFDASVAAHYVARHQDTPADALRWNEEALAQAEAVGDDRARPFFPSLYLNLGKSHEVLGDFREADRFYQLAESRLADLADDPYGDVVRQGVAAGRRRVATPP